MDRTLRVVVLALLAASACAQTTAIVLPNGTATAAGNVSFALPWGWWGTSAPTGMPDCFQHVSLDATRVFVPAGPTASMVFPVPNVPALSGTHLFWQVAAFANGLNPLGVISSHGLDLQIGTQ